VHYGSKDPSLHCPYVDLELYCNNPITEGDFKWIIACNCEGTEQLQTIRFYI